VCVKEVSFYMNLLPTLKTLDPALRVPTAYYGNVEEGVMVMEDMKRRGFVMLRQSGESSGGRFTKSKERLENLC
jgi:hypothetical protein